MSSEPKYVPPGRRLAKPPILDYEELLEDKIPSERCLRRLFTKDTVIGYWWREIIIELALLTYKCNHDTASSTRRTEQP